jgi:hypothetical protein
MEERTLPAAIASNRLSNRDRYHATRLKGRQLLEKDPTVKTGLNPLEVPLMVGRARRKQPTETDRDLKTRSVPPIGCISTIQIEWMKGPLY